MQNSIYGIHNGLSDIKNIQAHTIPKRKRFLIVYYEELLLQNSLNFANYDPKIKILKKLSNGRLIQRIFVLRHK